MSIAAILLRDLVLGREYSYPFQNLGYHRNLTKFWNFKNENFLKKIKCFLFFLLKSFLKIYFVDRDQDLENL